MIFPKLTELRVNAMREGSRSKVEALFRVYIMKSVYSLTHFPIFILKMQLEITLAVRSKVLPRAEVWLA